MSFPAKTASEAYDEAFRAGLKPEPPLTISEWADRYRTLSQRASAEPGAWRTDRTPYLREIMDALSPSSSAERVVFMKGSQIGGTEAGNNWIGYVIHQAPGPMLAVQPTTDMAKRNSKQRIDPLISESKVLRELVRDPRSRDSGNTVLAKEFPGGILVMTGANSAVGLRSMAARYLFLDEVDAYPGDADGEGDPVNLALARSRTFSRRKVFLVSTPKTAGQSRIERAYEESDQRKYFVPCPRCGEFQVFRFPRLRWPKGKPGEAVYFCEYCGFSIENHQKTTMLANGEWRPAQVGDGKTVGFHLSSLYSPVGWFSWGEAARMFDEAQKASELLRVFVNTVLGEPWVERGEVPDWERLKARAERYDLGIAPMNVLFLTAGIDVQRDRLEIAVWGWGRGKHRWLVDYLVLDGDTGNAVVWNQLDVALQKSYPHEAGLGLPIRAAAIDSGFRTAEVYGWARRHGYGRVIVVKGSDHGVALLAQPVMTDVTARGQLLRRGMKVWPVNVSMAKSELYSQLGQSQIVVHYPQMDDEWFRQLTAEQYVTRVVKGFTKGEWVKTRERNEALDTANYARAAASYLGLDRMNDENWLNLEAQMGLKAESSPGNELPKPVSPGGRPAASRKVLSSWAQDTGRWLDRQRDHW